ncbi:MAG TPA: hypothetical protein VMV92_22565 [Streptosporangiaceae bacterium]|nr:hypothetical protein [Streptosporangiaceae bacterium]
MPAAEVPATLAAAGTATSAEVLPGPAAAAADRTSAAHDGGTGPAGRGLADRPAKGWPAWRWAAGYLVAGAALFFCYLRLSRTMGVTSDGASNALQAWDMLHGNWLLHGWTLSDVSFYTTELPEYMVVELVRGLGPDVVHVAAAFTYTLLVLLAGLLAKGRATGREGLVRILIASGIMLAPQIGAGVFILLLSPDHVGTQVPLLAIWLLLDRAPRRWYVPVIAGLVLAWVEVADRLALTIGALPLVVVCGVRAYRGVVQRREPASSQWFELSLGAAALVSAPVAGFAGRVLGRLGGYAVQPLATTFAGSAYWPAHLALTLEGLLGLYGADISNQPLSVATAVILVHLAGLVLAGWAVSRAIRRFFRCDDLIAAVLTVAIVVNLIAYAFSVLPNSYWDTREIAAVLPLGAVLAGRLLAGPMIQARLLPALAAVLACYVLALGSGVAQPNPPAHDQYLAGWLAAHHLTVGLGSYAVGNSTTLDSGGNIQVRSVTWHRGALRAWAYESKSAWFDPRLHYADFVVTTRQDGRRFFIPYRRVIAAFGPPARTYHYRAHTIMIWNKNLLAGLPPSRWL